MVADLHRLRIEHLHIGFGVLGLENCFGQLVQVPTFRAALHQRHRLRRVELLVQLEVLQGLSHADGEFVDRVGSHAAHFVAAVDRAHLRILVEELSLPLELDLAELLLRRRQPLLALLLVLGRVPLQLVRVLQVEIGSGLRLPDRVEVVTAQGILGSLVLHGDRELPLGLAGHIVVLLNLGSALVRSVIESAAVGLRILLQFEF